MNYNSFSNEIISKFIDLDIIAGFFFFLFIICVFSFWSKILFPTIIYPLIILILKLILGFIFYILKKRYKKNETDLFIYCLEHFKCIEDSGNGFKKHAKNYPKFNTILKIINEKDFFDGIYKGINALAATLIMFILYDLNKIFPLAYKVMWGVCIYYILEIVAFIWINEKSEKILKIKTDELNRN